MCLLGDDVHCSRLQLDDEDLGVDALEILPQAGAVGEIARDVGDTRPVQLVEMPGEALVLRRRRRAEERHAGVCDGLERPRSQHDTDDGVPVLTSPPHGIRQLGMRRIRLRHRHEDEVHDSRAVGVQISGRDVDGLGGRRHQEASARIHRRQCGAAAVEHDEVGRQRTRDADALEDVRDRDGAGQAAPAAPAADRRDTGDDRRLEVVRGGVAAATGELEQRLQRRLDEDGLGLGRPAPPHRHDDDDPRSRELPRDVTGDGGLPDPLPVPITASVGTSTASIRGGAKRKSVLRTARRARARG